ncbi:MAG: NUDIX domain-containing protein [Propionibacteriaceae bacterium]
MSDSRLVVGAVIVDRYPHPRQVLVARRYRPAQLAGLWEFPGGKAEIGESAVAAVTRELAEELQLSIQVVGELVAPQEVWPINDELRMRLFFAVLADNLAATQAQPILGDTHDEVRWVSPDRLADMSWVPADNEPALVVSSNNYSLRFGAFEHN